MVSGCVATIAGAAAADLAPCDAGLKRHGGVGGMRRPGRAGLARIRRGGVASEQSSVIAPQRYRALVALFRGAEEVCKVIDPDRTGDQADETAVRGAEPACEDDRQGSGGGVQRGRADIAVELRMVAHCDKVIAPGHVDRGARTPAGRHHHPALGIDDGQRGELRQGAPLGRYEIAGRTVADRALKRGAALLGQRRKHSGKRGDEQVDTLERAVGGLGIDPPELDHVALRVVERGLAKLEQDRAVGGEHRQRGERGAAPDPRIFREAKPGPDAQKPVTAPPGALA